MRLHGATTEEERSGDEICGVSTAKNPQHFWVTPKTPAYNPAFDITPADLVTRWIFDTGSYNKKQIASGVLSHIA